MGSQQPTYIFFSSHQRKCMFALVETNWSKLTSGRQKQPDLISWRVFASLCFQGDGLEFKRLFVKIKQKLGDIISTQKIA